MSILNSAEKTSALSNLKAIASVSGDRQAASPMARASLLTELMGHGGLYTLLDTATMTARVGAMVSGDGGSSEQQAAEVESLVAVIQGKIANYFTHLNTDPYPIPSSLMSHIAFPHEGRCYTEQDKPSTDSDLSAAFTFLGQFIDHDLTMNAVNLFDTQTGALIEDASPFIDLDNVYGPRVNGDTLRRDAKDTKSLFEEDGRFKVVSRTDASGATVTDLERIESGGSKGKALIADKRDDENQLVLQIHLLFVRFHNILIGAPFKLSFMEAYQQSVFAFQAIILNDYLPKILGVHPEKDGRAPLEHMKAATKAIRRAADKGNWEETDVVEALEYLKYRPFYNPRSRTLSLSMPHEFAIGFRFGHSQFRDSYTLRPGSPAVPTFDNSLSSDGQGQIGDLRGSRPLLPTDAVDWPFFIANVRSKMIDTKVAKVAFDLPESAIPDDIKTIGNLVHRNLIRSRQVGVCSGESLASVYGVSPLTPEEVEPSPGDKPDLFRQFKSSVLGNGPEFQTPLWYYILKEAELKGAGVRLGPLGTRIIGEVILAAIYYNPIKNLPEGPLRLVVDDGWRRPPSAPDEVDLTSFAGLVDFVNRYETGGDDAPKPDPEEIGRLGESEMSDFDALMHNLWGRSECSAPDMITETQDPETLKVILQGRILTITALKKNGNYEARIYARQLITENGTSTFIVLPSLDSANDDPIFFRANGTAVIFRENGKLRLKAVGTDYTSGSCKGWVFDAREID